MGRKGLYWDEEKIMRVLKEVMDKYGYLPSKRVLNSDSDIDKRRLYVAMSDRKGRLHYLGRTEYKTDDPNRLCAVCFHPLPAVGGRGRPMVTHPGECRAINGRNAKEFNREKNREARSKKWRKSMITKGVSRGMREMKEAPVGSATEAFYNESSGWVDPAAWQRIWEKKF